MRGFNRAIIAGNLTKDPELRYTVNKKAYARFTLAVNNRYKDANGEWQDGADYIGVIAWGALAETVGKYLKKGSPVLVEGRIQTGSYDAKDGSGKRYTTDINISNMIMLGSREQMPKTSGQPEGVPVDFGSSIGNDDGFGRDSFSSSLSNDEIMDGSSNIPF